MVDLVYLPTSFDVDTTEFGAGGYLTQVKESRAGTEQRVSRRAIGKRTFTVSYNARSASDVQIVSDLFEDRRGMKLGFLARVWTDYQLEDELILTASGGETTAQIRRQIGTSNAFYRVIRYIEASTLVVKVNGTQLVVSSEYSVSATGLITFVSALSASDEVTVTCNYWTPVRFDTDEIMKSTLTPLASLQAIQRIPLVEVIE